MKKIIDKLISRLEEKRSEVNGLSDIVWNNAVKMCVDEVNQLAEEYKSNLSETLTSSDGWIPVSERLPSKEEIEEWATFLVTIRVRGKYDIMDFCLFGTDGKWLVSEGREVIAWKRQTPYQPKGE
jgi:hypothetical protein